MCYSKVYSNFKALYYMKIISSYEKTNMGLEYALRKLIIIIMMH